MEMTPANMTPEIARARKSSRGSAGLLGSPPSILATEMERRTAMMQKPAETSTQARLLPVTRISLKAKNAAVSWISTAATCSRTEMATMMVSSMSSTIRGNALPYKSALSLIR